MNKIDKILQKIAEQRNQALDALIMMTVEKEELNETLLKSFELLNQCILSGQIPPEDVPKLVASMPSFEVWRKQQS